MIRRFCCTVFILSILFLIACNNSTSPAAVANTGKDALRGNWYKRYTGTIAGYPVVVNMFCNGDNNAGGTYYYSGKSELLNLSFSIDTANAGHIRVTEYVITDRSDPDENGQRSNTWNIVMAGDHITGKFYKGGDTATAAINLKEDYTDAYRLGFSLYSDSTTASYGKWKAAASASLLSVLPTGDNNNQDADFINKSLSRFITSDSLHIHSVKDALKISIDGYLAGFKKEMAEMATDSAEGEPMQDYEDHQSIVPVYNARNILVVGNSYYSYSGGAHGNHGTGYLIMDIKQRKIMDLGDIIKVDSPAITNLLNAEARTKFNVAVGQPLDGTLLVDNVPATDNIIIADRGITFCYNPYEIASYADGEVLLFIPYTKLKFLLKPEFVARMGLKL